MVTLKISVSDTIKAVDVFGVFKKKQKTENRFSEILNTFNLVLDILLGGVQNYSRPPTSENIMSFTKATL